MNKRGAIIEVPWSFLIEMILLALIVVFLIVQANDVVKNDRFERLFHVRDVALLFNTVGSLTGSLGYSYELLGKYNLNVLRGKIEILQQNEQSGKGSVYYPFYEDSFLSYEYELLIPRTMEKRTTFTLAKNQQLFLNEKTHFVAEHCPVVATMQDEKKLFIVDPVLSDTVRKEAILRGQKIVVEVVKSAFPPDAQGVFFEREDTSGDVMRLYTSQTIKARKLACLFANELRRNKIPVVVFSEPTMAERAQIKLLGTVQGKEAVMSTAVMNALDTYFQKQQ